MLIKHHIITYKFFLTKPFPSLCFIQILNPCLANMGSSITTGAPKPELNIPLSAQTVDVRVIDSTARIKIPVAAFIQDKIPGHDFLECPAYSFLVEHSSGQKVLFDLGVRKDIDGFSPVILDRIKQIVALNGAMNVESDIATILRQGEDSIELEKINAIIWR